jgi:adenylate kinase
MDRGELVPDSVVTGLVVERTKQTDCARGFLLDGFPRTIAQADAIASELERRGQNVDAVISIVVPRQELVERLSGRWIRRSCQAMYHERFTPPKKNDVCDACGGELYQRSDDSAETVNARLEVYERSTAPLLSYYRERGLLHDVDGLGAPETISQRIITTLKSLSPPPAS